MVIQLGQGIMPINIYTKYHEDQTTTIELESRLGKKYK